LINAAKSSLNTFGLTVLSESDPSAELSKVRLPQLTNFLPGIMMGHLAIKLRQKTQRLFSSQLPFIQILSEVETTFWFFASATAGKIPPTKS
jgi:hypothetical protein